MSHNQRIAVDSLYRALEESINTLGNVGSGILSLSDATNKAEQLLVVKQYVDLCLGYIPGRTSPQFQSEVKQELPKPAKKKRKKKA